VSKHTSAPPSPAVLTASVCELCLSCLSVVVSV
jgi:hypothetical protein